MPLHVAPQRAIIAAKAWARAEAEGRITTGRGGDRRSDQFRKSGLIAEPAKHFAKLYGVSPDYAYWAKNVLAYSPALADQVVARRVRAAARSPRCSVSIMPLCSKIEPVKSHHGTKSIVIKAMD